MKTQTVEKKYMVELAVWDHSIAMFVANGASYYDSEIWAKRAAWRRTNDVKCMRATVRAMVGGRWSTPTYIVYSEDLADGQSRDGSVARAEAIRRPVEH
jgi:hypothetical protein